MYFDAVKLPYRGVLIERPCFNCDTTDMHFEGECSQGPCTVCGETRGSHYQGAIDSTPHDWTPNVYQPALIANAPDPFNEMVDNARLIGSPAHFSSDLYRDYQLLCGLGLYKHSEPVRLFIWGVRSTGTDVLTEHTTRSTAVLLLDRAEHIFEWNGFSLRETDRETALALLAAYRIGQRLGCEA